MPYGLLKTKSFSRPPLPNQVSRILVLKKLNSAWQRGIPCVLVSTPAGFGKTTLVSDWVRSSGHPFAWLILDEGDTDPLRVWRYVNTAFQTIDSCIGESLPLALHSMRVPVNLQIITELVNDIISSKKEFILVLRDSHVIEHGSIYESLNFLLDHLSSQMQLVITTRSDPPLNLALRRGREHIVEIRAIDLRFSPEEIATFLNQTMLLDRTDVDIVALIQPTEGWITGLKMVALSI
jgi:LuxR family maltose regulon positive regulatory protein